ncbi:uncharacterized protein METZ01_LOCUS214765 [marine metagenome]|uniref:Serine aminopeptidase S33 domain-containing protein n=1 Tax=marine metagenome TaxID=408172 RepID=A0A382FIV3_9ZZZZ
MRCQLVRAYAAAGLDVPTTVVHGTDDRLVPPGYGQRTADAIPGAEMVWIEGMGHEWPEEAWPRILDAITDLVERSGA